MLINMRQKFFITISNINKIFLDICTCITKGKKLSGVSIFLENLQ